ncbi:MAG: photosynthetic reaction center cytochrome c subunit family protein [Chloroflexota bacterium]
MANLFGNERNAFIAVFLGITGFLVLGAWSLLAWIAGVVIEGEQDIFYDTGQSPIYVDFQVDVDEYVSAQSYIAMAAYQQEHPMPRNVRIVTNYTTQELNGYMRNHFVAGLGVNCTYCHNINNFAAGPEWDGEDVPEPTEEGAVPHPNWEAHKANARIHLEMSQGLNQNWLANLGSLTDEKQPSGAQITCATCHYAQAQPQVWPEISSLPRDFRLPLDESMYGNRDDYLNITGDYSVGLDTVSNQQNIMYYMNSSMNVGCTHCHNSRYFVSREVPAIHYAQNMLNMTQYLNENYLDSMGGQMPSCWMCHRNAVIPPGSAVSVDVLPPVMAAPPSGVYPYFGPDDSAVDEMNAALEGDAETSDADMDETDSGG